METATSRRWRNGYAPANRLGARYLCPHLASIARPARKMRIVRACSDGAQDSASSQGTVTLMCHGWWHRDKGEDAHSVSQWSDKCDDSHETVSRTGQEAMCTAKGELQLHLLLQQLVACYLSRILATLRVRMETLNYSKQTGREGMLMLFHDSLRMTDEQTQRRTVG